MKRTLLAAILTVSLFFTACGGGAAPGSSSTGGTQHSSGPLDPQGNWLFSFYAPDTSLQLRFAGELFELHPPIVTGVESGSSPFGFSCGGMTANGQASDVSTIIMTVTPSSKYVTPFQLTGNIAPDEKSMSGTWTGGNGCTSVTSGNWSAQLLAPVTGSWAGTADNGLLLAASLTEDTSQTSAQMGSISGTVTVTGGGCFNGPVTLASTPGSAENIHLGEMLMLKGKDGDGVTLAAPFTAKNSVDPSGLKITGLYFEISGGKCDGQTFTADLTKQ